jgi:hypothetical protein
VKTATVGKDDIAERSRRRPRRGLPSSTPSTIDRGKFPEFGGELRRFFHPHNKAHRRMRAFIKVSSEVAVRRANGTNAYWRCICVDVTTMLYGMVSGRRPSA